MIFYVGNIIKSMEEIKESPQRVQVVYKDGTYDFELYEEGMAVSSFAVGEKDIEPGIVYNLRLSGKNGVYFSKENTRYQIYERYAGVFYQQIGCEVKFYKNSPTEECIALTNYSAWLDDGGEAKLWNGGFTELLASLYPDCERAKKSRGLRKDLICDLHANDSLSYIEAQMDFISLLLLRIVENNPEIKADAAQMFEDFPAFRKVLTEQNIFSIKPENECRKEIEDGKSLARKRQGEYYDAKYS